MPKISKEVLGYEKKYTEEDIEGALIAIKNGMSKKKASKIFGVPRATIIFRLSNKFVKSSHGPNPVLSRNEEETLVSWVISCQNKGFPRRQEDIVASVKEFLEKVPRENPFKNNTPGTGWFKAFLRRHPNLSSRTSEAVTSASSNVSKMDIKNWFANIEMFLKTEGCEEILNDPARVFNGDETNFQLCPKGKRVVALKGTRNVYEIDRGQSKSNLTVMFTFGANGTITPPMVIYPNKRRTLEISRTLPDDWGYGISENGWMKAELFYEYISNVLYPSLKNRGTAFPIILFVDSHTTHLTFSLSELCSKLQIILLALYPNATRILQPADVAAFKPLKDGWRKGVLRWRREHPTEALTKEKFAPILKLVIDTCLKKETIVHGFKACGLFPWNSDAIDYSKCLGQSERQPNKKGTGGHEENNTLNYQTFQEIVGDNLISQFEQIRSTENDEDTDFQKLYKIWYFFSSQNNSKEVLRKSNSLNFDTNEYDRNMPTVVPETEENDGPDNDIYTEDYYVDENYTLQKMETKSNEVNVDNVILFKKSVSIPLPGSLPAHESTDANDKKGEPSSVEMLDPEGLSTTLFTPGNAHMMEIPKLKDVLFWPKTPERKGKKQTERIPFAITSSKFKELQLRKCEEKKKKENAIAERKRKREENKMMKPNYKKEETAAKEPRKKIKRAVNIKKEIHIISDIQISNNTEKVECNSNTGHTLKVKDLSDEFHSENSTCERNALGQIDYNINVLNERHYEKKNCHVDRYLESGLCFICVFNITTENKGLKCISCTRKYHMKCLTKHLDHMYNGDTRGDFMCKTCQNKLYK